MKNFNIIELNQNKPHLGLLNRLKKFGEDMDIFKRKKNVDFQLDFYILDDFGMTLNENRFKSNLTIGTCMKFTGRDIFILETMINCCGIIAAKIPKMNISQIIESLDTKSLAYINCSRKNHFLNIYFDGTDNYYAIIHGSFSEVKKDTDSLKGLYPFKESYFFRNSDNFVGNHGNYSILIDDLAIEYKETVAKWDVFSKKERANVMKSCFPEAEIVFNESHMTVDANGTVLMGAYFTQDTNKNMYLTEGPEKAAGIFKPLQFNFIPELNGYLIPHGGGIDFDFIEANFHNEETVCFTKKQNSVLVNKLSDLTYGYKPLVKEPTVLLKPFFECKIG